GRDVDDTTEACRAHRRYHRPRHVERAVQMNVEHCLPRLWCQPPYHGVTSDAGIVDCDIDAADAPDRRVDDCLNTGAVCHIGRRASNLLDPFPRTSQSRLAAIDRGDRRARLREQLDNLVADALRGPGDENALAVEVEVDVHAASLACFGGNHPESAPTVLRP